MKGYCNLQEKRIYICIYLQNITIGCNINLPLLHQALSGLCIVNRADLCHHRPASPKAGVLGSHQRLDSYCCRKGEKKKEPKEDKSVVFFSVQHLQECISFCISRLFGVTGNCAACSKLIPAFEMVMRAKDNVYHLDCFACQLCNQR